VTVKKGFKPLEDAHLVDENQLAELRRYSISTVEELVGALGSRRDGVAKLLKMSDDDACELESHARAALDPETLRRFDELAREPFEPTFGARMDPPADR
jgi:hypothetical protein